MRPGHWKWIRKVNRKLNVKMRGGVEVFCKFKFEVCLGR